jgi:hypothetical protein
VAKARGASFGQRGVLAERGQVLLLGGDIGQEGIEVVLA